jgi:hypothetical protein
MHLPDIKAPAARIYDPIVTKEGIRAWRTWHRSRGPAIEIEGAQAYVDAVRRLAPVLVRNEIRRIFVDGAEACAIYDFVTDTAAGAARSVEWIKFDGSKIRSAELVFDQQMWAAVREELARRAPVSQ